MASTMLVNILSRAGALQGAPLGGFEGASSFPVVKVYWSEQRAQQAFSKLFRRHRSFRMDGFWWNRTLVTGSRFGNSAAPYPTVLIKPIPSWIQIST